MGGGGDGGGWNYYSEKQLELQKEALEQSKASVTEPVKSVSSKMTGASADAAREAQLRRGISSTFNRQTAFAPAGSGSATSGSSAKLGK